MGTAGRLHVCHSGVPVAAACWDSVLWKGCSRAVAEAGTWAGKCAVRERCMGSWIFDKEVPGSRWMWWNWAEDLVRRNVLGWGEQPCLPWLLLLRKHPASCTHQPLVGAVQSTVQVEGQYVPCATRCRPHGYSSCCHVPGHCRAVLVQLGFYLHMRGALGGAGGLAAITRPVAFATSFMLLFSIVIALFKDIPDVRGDSKVGLGPRCAICAADR